MKRIQTFILTLFVTICFSCSKNTPSPYLPPANLDNLISGDSTKVWKLAKDTMVNTYEYGTAFFRVSSDL